MSAQYVTAVLAQFDANIAAITNEAVNPVGGGFKASGYRFTADKEPDSAAEGLYYLDMPSTQPKERYWGTGENIWEGKITVQIAYYRGGGDMGGVDGGDRRSVSARANDDCMRLSDICENPANYNRNTTGIRWIRYSGHRRAYNLKKYEVWEVDFGVEWRSDVTTTSTIVPTVPDMSILTIMGEYGSLDAGGPEDVVSQPVYIDLDDFGWARGLCRLMGEVKVTGGTGTFRVRMGGTVGSPDGTVIAEGTTTSLSYVASAFTAASFANAGGLQLLQVTFSNDTVGQTAWINGISIGIRSAS